MFGPRPYPMCIPAARPPCVGKSSPRASSEETPIFRGGAPHSRLIAQHTLIPLPPLRRYVNATGLIWENAESFQALVVFAEHRYYGDSQPLGNESWRVDPSFLTTEQVRGSRAPLLWG